MSDDTPIAITQGELKRLLKATYESGITEALKPMSQNPQQVLTEVQEKGVATWINELWEKSHIKKEFDAEIVEPNENDDPEVAPLPRMLH
jgi:hypothetical protein